MLVRRGPQGGPEVKSDVALWDYYEGIYVNLTCPILLQPD